MNSPPAHSAPPARRQRSLADLLEPLDRQAQNSTRLRADSVGNYAVEGQTYCLRRFCFKGPQGGDDPVSLGLFAGVHGNEPAGAYALADLLLFLETQPDWARGYQVFAYPVCNPTGFEDNTRHSRRQADLHREFWKGSAEPEVQILQTELNARSFRGLVLLHSDPTSNGMYGYASGPTMARHVLEPALAAAETVLPRNGQEKIDGFHARNGIIISRNEDRLKAQPQVRPRPFEMVLNTPQAAPQFLQQKALLAALLTILVEYQKYLAYSVNL
jgi:murein peptide amidase A